MYSLSVEVRAAACARLTLMECEFMTAHPSCFSESNSDAEMVYGGTWQSLLHERAFISDMLTAVKQTACMCVAPTEVAALQALVDAMEEFSTKVQHEQVYMAKTISRISQRQAVTLDHQAAAAQRIVRFFREISREMTI